MPTCSHCGTIFYYSDYDLRQGDIYCSGCREKLPLPGSLPKADYTEYHLVQKRIDVIGFYEQDEPFTWQYEPWVGYRVFHKGEEVLSMSKRHLRYRGDDIGNMSFFHRGFLTGPKGKIKTESVEYVLRPKKFQYNLLTLAINKQQQVEVETRPQDSPFPCRFQDKESIPFSIQRALACELFLLENEGGRF